MVKTTFSPGFTTIASLTTIPINIDITILESDTKIKKLILKAMAGELNAILLSARRTIEDEIAFRMKSVFVGTRTYNAIINGPLDAHFGIPQGEALDRLDSIINQIVKSIRVDFKEIKSRGKIFTGGYTVRILRADFLDIINLSAAIVDNTSNNVNVATQLPWLEWLLIRGDNIIIDDYEIVFGSFSQSRSNAAIMVRNEASVWSVPPEFSGTIRKNWLTKSVLESGNFIADFVGAAIKKNVEKFF